MQFDLDRNIDAAAGDVQAAINAASGQLPKNLPSPPTYRKVNPSDAPILILAVQSDARAADRGRRLRRQHPVAADLADRRRRAGVHRRRAEARGARAGRSRQACRHGPDAGGRARYAGQRHGRTRRRARSTPRTARSRSTTTTSSPRASEYNNVILAYRNGAPVRVRDIGQAVDGAGERLAGGLAERQARDHAAGLQAARRQRHRHGGAHQGGAAGAGGRRSRRRSMSA